MLSDEWVEFEYAMDLAYELLHELEIAQSFTAAFVKGAHVAVPRVSFVVSPDGHFWVKGSVQYLDTPIYEREWKDTAREPTVGTFSIAPHLITSVMWDYGHRYPKFDIFGGLRLGATWSKELHGRRAHVITYFASLAFGAVIIGEQKAKGRIEAHPFGASGLLQVGARWGIGRRESH